MKQASKSLSSEILVIILFVISKVTEYLAYGSYCDAKVGIFRCKSGWKLPKTTNPDDRFYQLGHFFLLFSAFIFSILRHKVESLKNHLATKTTFLVTKWFFIQRSFGVEILKNFRLLRVRDGFSAVFCP